MPSETVTAVTVNHPGGTIFIGSQTQFHATATMSNGTTQAATNATWSSDAPGIATVSSTGLVSPLKAGETTISADFSVRGSKHIRVYPNFGGTWAGNNVVLNCQALGAFVGAFCMEDAFAIGAVFVHDSKLHQTNDAVEAEIRVGDVETARMSGTISIDGELQLPSAAVLPSIEGSDTEVRNWRSRADQPSRMSGTYDLHITIPGFSGSATVSFRLDNVVKLSSTMSVPSVKGTGEVAQNIRRAITRIARP